MSDYKEPAPLPPFSVSTIVTDVLNPDFNLPKVYLGLLWLLPKEALMFVMNQSDIFKQFLLDGELEINFRANMARAYGFDDLQEIDQMFALIGQCWTGQVTVFHELIGLQPEAATDFRLEISLHPTTAKAMELQDKIAALG